MSYRTLHRAPSLVTTPPTSHAPALICPYGRMSRSALTDGRQAQKGRAHRRWLDHWALGHHSLAVRNTLTLCRVHELPRKRRKYVNRLLVW
jgi:hypothetical protein